ncbi:MAG TPA: hypothetical protein VKP59_06290 [Candidatus Thermoplasmatota archaeon]|nr:hypothetical protein [Candidatus Thermoplasmatota archaeon]
MKRITIFLVIGFLFCVGLFTSVSAEDIVFSVNQNEYYFLTGQQAIVPLHMNNTYEEQIDGKLIYTIMQTISQSGGQYSSSNSQSQSFSVPNGNNSIQINFGRYDQPLTLSADLEFSFTHDDETRIVTLNDIVIHFVSNQSQMNNQKNSQQSSSEEIKNAEPSSENQQQSNTPQEKLQNNQMNQDSQALKDQIEQKMADEQQQKEAFEDNLFDNQEFQKQHQSLQDQGYNISQKQLDAESNDTGSFNLSYENKQGETASFKGSMDDGKLTDFQKQTAEDRKHMMDALNQSEQFQTYQEQLEDEGYNQTDISFDQNENTTEVKLSYENEENKTASITAEFLDEKLEDVRLSKENDIHPLLWITPLFVFVLVIVLFIYLKYGKNKADESVDSKMIMKKPFDYKKEAKRLLIAAERLYKQGDHKMAYAKAGQSLRLYLSYEYGLKKEVTNEDILHFLKDKRFPYDEIKQCFEMCSLVEFAKYTGSDYDFKQVYSTVSSIVSTC